MRKLRTLFFCMSFVLFYTNTNAQQPLTAAAYPFVANNKPFNYLSGATNVGFPSWDDDYVSGIPIGFSFTYCGVAYTTVTAQTNGWMIFGNNTSAQYNYPANTSYVVPCVFAGWCDAIGPSGATATYLTTGSAPNRVFTMEYRNWSNWSGSPATYISYQFKLYEDGGVELLYKQETGSSVGFASGAAIGIGRTTTDWQTLSSTGTSPTSSSTVFNTSTIAGTRPVTGQSYYWGIEKKGYNNAAMSALLAPASPFCSGAYTAQVQLKNKGKNQINNVRVYWELDGVPQPFVTSTTLIDTIGSINGNIGTVNLGSVTYSNTPRTIKAYTSVPNGIADTVTGDDTLTFVRRSSPLALITTTGQTVYCGGGAVNTVLNATAGTGYSYQWRLNSVNIPGATNTTYTATSAGDYTLRVDSGGCFNISPILRIDNLAMPQPSISPETYAVYCDGDSLTLNANAGISGATYQWLLQGINIPGATNASYVAKMPGNYVVKTTKFNCTVSSPGTNVSQVPAPTPTITKNINVLSTAGNYVWYKWYVDGTILPNDTFSTCIAKVAGTYTVKVSNGGCSATASGVDITASEAATSVNSMGYTNAIRIYPNPVTSSVHIASPIAVKANITTVDGKILLQGDATTEYDMSSFANGMYIIRITDKDGNILKIDKLVKAAH